MVRHRKNRKILKNWKIEKNAKLRKNVKKGKKKKRKLPIPLHGSLTAVTISCHYSASCRGPGKARRTQYRVAIIIGRPL